MLNFFNATIIILLLSSAAGAASFDCDKANKADEKAICENRALNDADVRMSTMFELSTKLVAMGERDGLRATQLKWLEKRAACSGDIDCLRTVYDERIVELEKIFADFESRVAE